MSSSPQHNELEAHLSTECALSLAPKQSILKRKSDREICNQFDHVPKKDKINATNPRAKAEQVGSPVIEADVSCESDYKDLPAVTTILSDYMKYRPPKSSPGCTRNRERGVASARQRRTLLIQDVIVGI